MWETARVNAMKKNAVKHIITQYDIIISIRKQYYVFVNP